MVRRPAILLFVLWCLVVVVLFTWALVNGTSPLADGPTGGGGSSYGARGPRHK